ncbi:hypothetical protein BKA65DRAFT_494766 [Rhexocercosporidium sp. MPI-PUGE-AT-0058]|nr:hypothetical protein BKA65DRAFT_494766 [Rhexocercosporidium sp. MPI-PUGE-AT-0058]
MKGWGFAGQNPHRPSEVNKHMHTHHRSVSAFDRKSGRCQRCSFSHSQLPLPLMVEVEIYILGVSFLLKSTSTSIYFCIQIPRAIFTSIHILHAKPIIDQPLPSTPPQTFRTAPTSPIVDSMSSKTYTEEEYANAQQIVDSRKAIPMSTAPSKTDVFTRVSVHCAEPGCDPFMTGHEIVKLKLDSTYDGVGLAIKKKFRELQDGTAKARSNVRHCLWSANDHKIDSIKVNWSGAHSNGWSDNGETILTEENCKDILIMMGDRAAVDTMTVIISAKE